MAEPRESYPESATHGAPEEPDGEGERALRAAVDEHGEDLAAAVERTDELDDVLATAILTIASADEDDLEHLTESTANLVEAADGLTTEEAAALASDLGDNADDLGEVLETVTDLQREGHLDDLVTLSTAFSGSLSATEVEELATMLEDNGTELVEALDHVLELQRAGQLADLVAIAKALSVVEVDPDAARGTNDFLGAVGEARRESEPVGILGMIRGLRSADARAGMGYLLALLKAQGRRVRE